jgi:hypothetical protein
MTGQSPLFAPLGDEARPLPCYGRCGDAMMIMVCVVESR